MADTKISALTAATAVVAANEFAINEAGTSKKVTALQVQQFAAIQPYATGSFTVPTGYFVSISRHLILTSTQRVTLAGNATLRLD